MISLNDKFQPLFTTECRYVLVTGGRGSAKSFSVSVFAVLNSFAKKMRSLVTRWTLTSANLSIIPEFQEKIDLMEASQHFDVNKSDIVNNIL